MKTKKYLLPALFFMNALTGCKSEDKPVIPEVPDEKGKMDVTTNCLTGQETGLYQTYYRPQQGFVGDPMPYYNADDKKFYLFYLYENANRHPIYLTRTSDYGLFEGFTEVLQTGAIGSQDEWIGTGSFLKKGSTHYCFYTGHNSNLNPVEKVMLATSNDLLNWTKQPAVTIQAPEGYDRNNFRDPHVYWDDLRNMYVMLVTTRKNGKGTLARYTSSDLTSWVMIDPLVAATGNSLGKNEIETDAELLECPDIFKIGDKWYLTFSRINRDEHRKTFYRIADSPEGPWKISRDASGHHETFDGLYLYAGKTTSDGTSHYISGWSSTGQTVNNNKELPWAGNLVTHKLVRQANGRLYPVIPEAVDRKFNKELEFAMIKSQGDVSGDKGSYRIIAQSSTRSYALFNRNTDAVKLSMTIDATQSDQFGFSFGACDNPDEVYSVLFDLTATNRWNMPSLFMYKEARNGSNTGRSELNFTPLIVPSSKVFKLKIIIEKSICVVYVNDQVAFTNRILKMDQNPWTLFADKGSVEISGMKIEQSQ